MQERRKKYEDNPGDAWDILEAGSERAREVADATMDEVRSAMGLDYGTGEGFHKVTDLSQPLSERVPVEASRKPSILRMTPSGLREAVWQRRWRRFSVCD